MKVPPPTNLIVCALPPQTIARHFVLAAVAYVSVLCGAARAQSAPAAPPLSLGKAVELSYEVPDNTTAVLESSKDLSLWQQTSDPADYTGDVIRYIAAPSGSGFFRVRTDTRPAAGKSRWELTGTQFVTNTAAGPALLTFSTSGGTRQSAAGIVTFTWEWLRTGRNTGTAVLSLPDGSVESMDIQFATGNAGVFTSESSRDGLPGAVVVGTFRDEVGTTPLEPSAPAQAPENATITFSGTGRSVRIDLDSSGHANISSPVGDGAFPATWSSTGATTAELLLSRGDSVTELYDLNFTGPSCGTYTLRMEKYIPPAKPADPGTHVLRRSAAGTFTIAPR